MLNDSFFSSVLLNLQPVTGQAINAVKFDPSGDYLFLAAQNRLVYLLNSSSGKIFSTYEAHHREVLDLFIDKSSSKFVSCGGDKTVFHWDIERPESPRKYYGHTMRINSVCMNDEGSLIVSGSFDTTVQIFDTRSRQKRPIQTLTDAKDSISSVCINQYQIISGSVDGYIRTYDIRQGSKIFDCISEPVTCISESSDNNCILSSSLDNTIRLLDKSDGTLLNSFTGHSNKQYRLKSCFDKNDEFVFSGSEDSSIYIWEMLSGNVLNVLNAHSNIVCSVDVSPDNLRLASSSVNGQVIVWGSS
ncbi:hypothetical protein BB560_006382 [Smittium megazygosporum]|uniref:Uncharacterized protein n=1 Tax=Smittium megazygosporum TaxID=133381 RepID=A0A2T9Y7M8_9FUNG|nr:hypothetical protein BB560_006382 [Smittium megazygosporum]